MIIRVSDSYRHNIAAYIFGPFLKIIEAIFDLLIPLFMKAVIDLTKFGDVNLMPESNVISKNLGLFIRSFGCWITDNRMLSDALIAFSIILTMGIVGFLITMITQYIASITAMKVGTEIRESLINKILTLSKKETNKINEGKLQNIVNNDTYIVQQGTLLFIRLIVRMPTILIGSLIVSFLLDYRIGFIFVAIVPIVMFITLIIMRYSSFKYVGIQANLDDISEKTSDVIEGEKIIRGFNKQNYEENSFRKYNDKYKKSAIHVGNVNSLINPLTFAITSIAIIAICLFAGNSILSIGSNEGVAIATTVIAEISFLAQISFTLTQFASTFLVLVKSRVSEKRINDVLLLETSKDNNVLPKDYNVVLYFEDVSLRYVDGGNNVLKHMSFSLNKGESLGIIGATGSGKSSIVSLIERYVRPSEGKVSIFGVDVNDIDAKVLRSKISYVSQKASFLQGSIKDNILMSNQKLTDEEIIESLKVSEAYEFVSKYKDGINHIIEENGLNFSGGQRQRLNIARALAKQCDLYIFDDCFSALDFITDKKIRQNIINIYPNASKIYISQRVGSILNCDKILVIDGGEIIAQGKHDDLLKNCQIYKDLYISQKRGSLK